MVLHLGEALGGGVMVCTLRAWSPPRVTEPAVARNEGCGGGTAIGRHRSTRPVGHVGECPLVVFVGVREWLRLTFGKCSDMAILWRRVGTCFAIDDRPSRSSSE